MNLCSSELLRDPSRPPVRESLDFYTDGSHTAGKPARLGVAIIQKQKRHFPGNGNMFSRQHFNGIPPALEDRYSHVGLEADSTLSLGAKHDSNNSGEIQAACEAMLEVVHRPPTSTVW